MIGRRSPSVPFDWPWWAVSMGILGVRGLGADGRGEVGPTTVLKFGESGRRKVTYSGRIRQGCLEPVRERACLRTTIVA